MRFGQLEVRTIATLMLARFALVATRGLPASDPPDADDQPASEGLPMIATRAPRASQRSLAAQHDTA